MRLIVVFILLLLVYLLNNKNFIGGSINNNNNNNNNNDDSSNKIHQNRPKLASEIKTQKQKEQAIKKVNNVSNSIDNAGEDFNKEFIETENSNRKSYLAYYLSTKLDELEGLMDKMAKPIKKSSVFQQL